MHNYTLKLSTFAIEVFSVKRYLTIFFIGLSAVILVIGLRTNTQWSGIVSWGLSFIFLICAAYFTKYISNEDEGK
ncbi:MAG: Group-specific protein [Virgibacillus proomii]|jgi:energy-coupling factor transporter transmembrane protein EcfT